MKKLTILGSTGSIGTQALDIVRHRPSDFTIMGLSAGRNFDLLLDQIKEFKPKFVTIICDSHKEELSNLFPELIVLRDIKELAAIEVDIVLSAIVGIAGLEANLEALKSSKRLAVANKETLVSAGHLVREYCAKYNSEIIPVDSEHVAIHQCLYGSLRSARDDVIASDHVIASEAKQSILNTYKNPINDSVKEILLTSSGGPFRTLEKEKFKEITLADALKHPTWNMGAKITVDSSTLMNKALELIEVNSLFGIDYDQIKIVIHPQSVVHSAVTFVDGNTMAQLGSADMRVPIQYSLDYPDKKPLATEDSFDLFKSQTLEFFEPDRDRFPALDLAYKVGSLGHSYPAVFNSANESAVALFLKEEIKYNDIISIIESELDSHKLIKNPGLDEILNIDNELKASIKGALKS